MEELKLQSADEVPEEDEAGLELRIERVTCFVDNPAEFLDAALDVSWDAVSALCVACAGGSAGWHHNHVPLAGTADRSCWTRNLAPEL